LLALPDIDGPLYLQLYRQLQILMLDGVWQPGTRLPSSRTLARDLGISRNTAAQAIAQLEADGWVEARPRAGVFVAGARPVGSRPPEVQAE